MKEQVRILTTTRGNFKVILDTMAPGKLVEIPNGFKNNILWNVGHVLVTWDLLANGRAGIPMRLAPDFIVRYRKGSIPQGNELADLDYIRREMDEGIKHLEELIDSDQKFTYDPYMTSYNFQLNTWEDAVRFNNIHESLHLGYVMAMIKSLLH